VKAVPVARAAGLGHDDDCGLITPLRLRRHWGGAPRNALREWGVEMRARSTGLAWEILAPAKLNLYLEVLGRRDDGFHELDTVMTRVRVFDRLAWSPGSVADAGAFSLSYHPATSREIQQLAPASESNLVSRAFAILGQTAGIEPHGRATLFKRIPVQAGMGGASSDAAAALMLANAAWGVHYPVNRLAALAAELGSDVPFFLAGGPAICRGRGERVEPTGPIPRLHLIVAKPPGGVSTAAAFQALSAPPWRDETARNSHGDVANLVECLKRGTLRQAATRMVNRLQSAAASLNPWIERLQQAFAHTDCLTHMMTGSGSACFGVARSARHALCIARQLAAQGWGRRPQDGVGLEAESSGTVFTTATC
jgi:4-diphosphocytidyl-2-C-methyl-D-erythritol kinase